ncbi:MULTISPECIES: diacylglycerol kinase family protein [unclassified Paraflavitalea]|uniref:diacylglycerol kinase family protein n=1 Tax=unclassified Paraflavitalea TaxID=2798305 RepID=UPI003D326E37
MVKFILARFQSFGPAFKGLFAFVKKEGQAKIHLLATIVVIAASFYFQITKAEWIAVVFAIALVWATEMLNTAIEKLVDFCSDERLPILKFIKDVAAGAVLIAAFAAIAVALIIFLPYLSQL